MKCLWSIFEDTTRLCSLLEIGGASVCAATTALKALRFARGEVAWVVVRHFDAEMDGFEFLSRLRERLVEIYRVALTGFWTPEDVPRACEQASTTLTKPSTCKHCPLAAKKSPPKRHEKAKE